MTFTKKDGAKYECEILNEGKLYYEVALKGTNEKRLILKSTIGKRQIDGIAEIDPK